MIIVAILVLMFLLISAYIGCWALSAQFRQLVEAPKHDFLK